MNQVLKGNILIVCGAIAFTILILVGLAGFLRHKAAAPLSQPPLHGVLFVIEAEAAHGDLATNDLALLKAALLKRADRVGVRIYWEPLSETRVHVVVATRNAGEAQWCQSALFRRGWLEFQLVHEESDRLIETGEIPSGYHRLKHEQVRPSGSMRIDEVVVKQEPELGLSGNLIKRAMVARGNLGEPEISFTMQPDASAAFARVTRDNVGRRLAIVIDGELFSAPTIVSPIESGGGMITGQSDLQEAVQLAGAIECPLPFSIQMVETKSF